MQSSFFGGDTGLTYEDLQKRREMALLMNRRGANDRPARNIWEGLNSAAKSVSGALLANKMGGEMKGKEDAFRETLASTGMDPQMMALMENMSLPDQQRFALQQRQAELTRARAKPPAYKPTGAGFLGGGMPEQSTSQGRASLPFNVGTTAPAPTGGGVPMASMQPPVVSSSNPQSALAGLYQDNLQPPNSFAPPSAESQTALLGDMADPALSSVSPQAYRKPMPPPDATPVNGFDISSGAGGPLSFGQLDRQQAPAPQQNDIMGEIEQTRARYDNAARALQSGQLNENQMADARYAMDIFGKHLGVLRERSKFDNPEDTTAIQEYEYDKKQGFVGTLGDWKRANAKAGANNNTITMGDNSSDFMKEADKQAVTRLGGYTEQARASSLLIGDIRTLGRLSQEIGAEGKGAQAIAAFGPYLDALGIEVEGLSAAQAYKSITDKLAPQMRPVGAGSSSDKDVAMFLNSLPNLGNMAGGNALIEATFEAITENHMKAGEFANMAFTGELTWQEAEEKIHALPSPYVDFKKAKASLKKKPDVVPSAEKSDEEIRKELGLE